MRGPANLNFIQNNQDDQVPIGPTTVLTSSPIPDNFNLVGNNAEDNQESIAPAESKTQGAKPKAIKYISNGTTERDDGMVDLRQTGDAGKLKKQLLDNPTEENSNNEPALNAELTTGAEFDQNTGSLRMQALRSASNWSLGRLNTESSIYSCYCELIKNAQNFIYIENPFFISSTSKTGVEN